MPPTLAALVCLVAIVALMRWERDRASAISHAVWIPVTWLALAASREPSVWLSGLQGTGSPSDYLAGHPIDQLVFAGLIIGGLLTLMSRRDRTGWTIQANVPVLLFLAYGLLSVLWSDYPDVALKRWIRALGTVVMVLVVATDRDPAGAFRAVLTRTGFLLIPLSVLLIKYYPSIGRTYSGFTGTPHNIGVAGQKNSLGHLCLLVGLTNLWCLLALLRARGGLAVYKAIAAHAANLLLALWLLRQAGSATSAACFVLGAVVITLTARARANVLKPARLHLMLAGAVWITLLGLLTNIVDGLAAMLGREVTLTGRTELWDDVVALTTDPLLGTGFESFWLGPRAELLWNKFWWHPNQAHNGYLEMYLNLGWVGVALLLLVLAWGYGQVVNALARDPELGRLKLTFFVVALLYNYTEAAFKAMHPVWIVFLLSMMVVPHALPREHRRASTAARARRMPFGADPHEAIARLAAGRER